MAEPKRADVVFVIDASDSMRPCFEQLKTHIKSFVKPFIEEGFDSLRLGLVAYNAGINRDNGGVVFWTSFMNGNGTDTLYQTDPAELESILFTRSGDGFVDVDAFCKRLDEIECQRDEDTLLALDCAVDFPFEPLCSARRSIILFTDERIEDGVCGQEALGANLSNVEKIMKKLDARHISLYYFGPSCAAVDEVIGTTPRVLFQKVPAYGELPAGVSTWDNLNFDETLKGIGKDISDSVVQRVEELEFQKATFGQDTWGRVTNANVDSHDPMRHHG